MILEKNVSTRGERKKCVLFENRFRSQSFRVVDLVVRGVVLPGLRRLLTTTDGLVVVPATAVCCLCLQGMEDGIPVFACIFL